MEKPNEINYVCARWRDAITDPPSDGRVVLLHDTIMGVVAAQRVTEINPVGKTIHGWRMVPYRGVLTPQPGDQWLDITTIPAVPRAAVQAAVDELHTEAARRDVRTHGYGCNDDLIYVLDVLRDHTGVTPTEVTNG